MIAQMNYSTALAPLDSPIMAEFMAGLDRINALAEASDGFIWRLKDESGNATSIDVMSDPKSVLNVTVWASVEALYDFAYRSDHHYFIKHRERWFVPSAKRSMALWNLGEGAPMPSVEEAFARLRHLEEQGSSRFAFDWKGARAFADKDAV